MDTTTDAEKQPLPEPVSAMEPPAVTEETNPAHADTASSTRKRMLLVVSASLVSLLVACLFILLVVFPGGNQKDANLINTTDNLVPPNSIIVSQPAMGPIVKTLGSMTQSRLFVPVVVVVLVAVLAVIGVVVGLSMTAQQHQQPEEPQVVPHEDQVVSVDKDKSWVERNPGLFAGIIVSSLVVLLVTAYGGYRGVKHFRPSKGADKPVDEAKPLDDKDKPEVEKKPEVKHFMLTAQKADCPFTEEVTKVEDVIMNGQFPFSAFIATDCCPNWEGQFQLKKDAQVHITGAEGRQWKAKLAMDGAEFRVDVKDLLYVKAKTTKSNLLLVGKKVKPIEDLGADVAVFGFALNNAICMYDGSTGLISTDSLKFN